MRIASALTTFNNFKKTEKEATEIKKRDKIKKPKKKLDKKNPLYRTRKP